MLSAAEVKPEDVSHFEIGFKASPTPGSTANLTFFNTEIEDFQTQVTNSQFGVARGYLANAEKVRVRGAEFDGNVNIGSRFAVRGSVAYTDAEYVSFTDAPPPLEGTGGPAFVDASGGVLPGVSDGRRRSAPSTAGRATSSASPASSSRASTSTTAMTSRRARHRRST